MVVRIYFFQFFFLNFLILLSKVHFTSSFLLSGPPIILSPETGVGLKEGAKTGLATFVCGLCFFVCTFFSPLFAQIPSSGTMPMLFMVREELSN